MAHELQNLIWLVSTKRTSEKFVLMALCDRANKKNNMCWPSHKDISKRTGYSNKTVRRAIKTLCELGIISYVKRRKADGGLTSNLYTIHAEKLAKWAAKVSTMTRPQGNYDPRGTVTMTDKPLTRTFNRTISNSKSSSQDHALSEARLISEQRKREICAELSFDINKFRGKNQQCELNYAAILSTANKTWIVE